ncbi:MAG: 30S ribosomal protein S1 [Proteobacteria bacterium]|nr:30S ribosomal protein S1 [Pseudomonadota bacterium]MBU4327803.1 30S ribosomal protein S1 [Pseudomonadota bacterium]
MNQETTEPSFADLFQESSSKSLRRLEPGQKITATIVGHSGNSVFLDVGGKNEGILESSELMNKEGELSATIGDKVEVYFLKSTGGAQLFTIKLGGGKNTTQLEEAWRNAIPVEGLVKEEIKGGFDITLGGSVRAFCPFSQMGLHRVDDAGAEYTGRHMTFLITRFEENGRNIVVSARALLEQEREQQKEALQESLVEGGTVHGTISSIRDFGAFVDIGGVDGLIPISEIGWSRVEDIKEHLTVGQEVTAVIKKLDWKAGRITLSLKETLPNPWDMARENFTEGSTHSGIVARLTTFGAFVTLAPGVDGLIHISKLGGGRRINHPREVLEEGQEIEVKIEGIDNETRKISLAPTDYVSSESEETAEKDEYKKFTSKNKPVKKQEEAVGSLGALLQEKLKNLSK